LRRIIPSGPALRKLGIVSLVGLGFYGTSLLLVAMVELPYSRYADACHLFLPALVAYGFVGVARSLGTSVRALAGPATRESIARQDATPPDEREGKGRAGCRRKALGWLALCGVAAISGWLGWRVLAGGHDEMDRFLDAVQRGDSNEVTRMLEQNPGWARRSSAAGVSGLHVAAMDGQQTLVELLLRRGADAGATDRDGLTPLHWATVAGRAALVNGLLAYGADPNAASKGGIRPVHLARTAAVVSALVRGGAKLDVADGRGFGPLHRVLEPDAATALVRGGADPNQVWRDAAGAQVVPPLQQAIKKFNGTLGKRLLELGADPNARDAQGKTPLFVSLESWQTLLDDLLARRADPTLTVELASLPRWLQIAGVSAFAHPSDNMTVLHLATLVDQASVIQKLAASVADVNIQSRLGMTPLHWAAAANKPQAVAALLACGADPSVRNNAGQTPLDLAAGKSHRKVAEMLRRVAPHPKAPGKAGR
jgi:ankyrin